MKSKWIIILAILVVAVVINIIRSVRDKKRLKRIANEREAMTLERFYDFFPKAEANGLDAIFYRLQDMLYIEHDKYFPIEPSDQIHSLYNIDRKEFVEMVGFLADDRKISKDALTGFLDQYDNPTVSDLVMYIDGQNIETA
jgi:hypothetical protein